MLTEYLEPTDHTLTQIRFSYADGVYHGRGVAKWDPKTGFEIEAPVSRVGSDIGSMGFGYFGFVRDEHLHPIWMRSGWQRDSWMLAPRVPLVDRFDVVANHHLFLRVPTVLFGDPAIVPEGPDDFWYGSGLLQLGRSSVFPDTVVARTTLDSHTLRSSASASGLNYEDDTGLQLIGEKPGSREDYFQFYFRLPRQHWTRTEAWRWPCAVRDALAISLDCSVHLLQRTMRRGNRSYNEVTRLSNELPSLSIWPLLGFAPVVHRDKVVQLSCFFARNTPQAEVVRMMFNQMIAATSQRNFQARELLTSTILEASLRTLNQHPFAPGDRTFKIRPAVAKFVNEYLKPEWRDHSERVLQIYFRLRDRNAHPDWLFTSQDRDQSDRHRHDQLRDAQVLARFYGFMIFALAGLELPDLPAEAREI